MRWCAVVNSALFPSRSDRLTWDHYLTTALADVDQRVAQGPATPTIRIDDFKAELAAFDFAEPRPMEDLLAWTIARLEAGLVHMNHPRYLGLFNPAPTFPSQCADRIAATFNPQLATATTSPAAVEIEAHVIRCLATRIGFDAHAFGHFTSGGSEANYTALLCALTRAQEGFATSGARAFAGQPVFYVSRDCHLAWIKIAHQAGIGRLAVRLVATDGMGRMSATALDAVIQADRADGFIPFMIVATAGTTNAGMIDPLDGCAKIARREMLWYHIDAAWGGALIASEKLRHHLAGIDRADSVTIDAHKWFATTMGCGMFFVADPAILSAAFNVSASFMPSNSPMIDPYVTTAQWSRRFTGLRLFLSLAAGSWDGYAAHVEKAAELVGYLVQRLTSFGWSVVNDPALAVACFVPPGGSPPVKDIVRRVVMSGGAWVSSAVFEGQDVIRACVTHGETSRQDIVDVASLLEQARHGESCLPSAGRAS